MNLKLVIVLFLALALAPASSGQVNINQPPDDPRPPLPVPAPPPSELDEHCFDWADHCGRPYSECPQPHGPYGDDRLRFEVQHGIPPWDLEGGTRVLVRNDNTGIWIKADVHGETPTDRVRFETYCVNSQRTCLFTGSCGVWDCKSDPANCGGCYCDISAMGPDIGPGEVASRYCAMPQCDDSADMPCDNIPPEGTITNPRLCTRPSGNVSITLTEISFNGICFMPLDLPIPEQRITTVIPTQCTN